MGRSTVFATKAGYNHIGQDTIVNAASVDGLPVSAAQRAIQLQSLRSLT
jgi:hypothetical protein